MVKNKEKHRMAFCISAFTLLAGLSLIAVGIAASSAPTIASCSLTGAILTTLSIIQSVESYFSLQRNEKLFNKMINGIRDEPESKLFIERIIQPFAELFSELKQHS